MYYLFSSPSDIRWTTLPFRQFAERLKERPETDISDWNWNPATEPSEHEEYLRIDETHLRIALRKGFLNASGILVDATEFSDYRSIKEMVASHAKHLRTRGDLLRQAADVDTLYPGYLASTTQDVDGLDESLKRICHERQKSVDDTLRKPLDTALVRYWESVGGRVPDVDLS